MGAYLARAPVAFLEPGESVVLALDKEGLVGVLWFEALSLLRHDLEVLRLLEVGIFPCATDLAIDRVDKGQISKRTSVFHVLYRTQLGKPKPLLLDRGRMGYLMLEYGSSMSTGVSLQPHGLVLMIALLDESPVYLPL